MKKYILYIVVVLALVCLGFLIYQAAIETPGISPVVPLEELKPIEPNYERIAEELREKDKQGIGHINPGDSLKTSPGELPPERR